MQVDILYFEDCPNHLPTKELVHDVARSLGLDATIRDIRVRGAEDAARLKFFGSPTVQVNGRDIDPAVRGSLDYSLSCRTYGGSGSPSRALVEKALREGRPKPDPARGEAR